MLAEPNSFSEEGCSIPPSQCLTAEFVSSSCRRSHCNKSCLACDLATLPCTANIPRSDCSTQRRDPTTGPDPRCSHRVAEVIAVRQGDPAQRIKSPLRDVIRRLPRATFLKRHETSQKEQGVHCFNLGCCTSGAAPPVAAGTVVPSLAAAALPRALSSTLSHIPNRHSFTRRRGPPPHHPSFSARQVAHSFIRPALARPLL